MSAEWHIILCYAVTLLGLGGLVLGYSLAYRASKKGQRDGQKLA